MLLFDCLSKQLQDDEVCVRVVAAGCWGVLMTLTKQDQVQCNQVLSPPDGKFKSSWSKAANQAFLCTLGNELFEGPGTHIATMRPTVALTGLLYFIGEI